MHSLNKAGLLGSALIALLVITSCSDSGTSTTGITPLSRDAAEAGAINNATLKKEGDHDHGPQGHESTGIADPGQGEGLDHQHGEPHDFSLPGIVTESVISEKTPTSRDEADAGGPAPKAATKAAPKASSTASIATTATDNPPTTSTDNPPTSQDTPTDTGSVCPTGPEDWFARGPDKTCDSPGKVLVRELDHPRRKAHIIDTWVCDADCKDVTLRSSEAVCTNVDDLVFFNEGGIAFCDSRSCEVVCKASNPPWDEDGYVQCLDKCHSGSPSSPSPAICGDGQVTGDEVCDDSNGWNGKTQCQYGTSSCSICNATCTGENALTGPYCGDAIVNAGEEECDDGDNNGSGSSACNNACQLTAEPEPGVGTSDNQVDLAAAAAAAARQ